MRLVILGGPGAGKGTQAYKLCNHFQIPLVSIGDILREAIAAQTELGKKAEPYVAKGELVPDLTMIKFVRDRLLEPDTKNGWLLDGYPRTAFQAEELDFLLDTLEQKLDWAIFLNTPEDVLMQRCQNREYRRVDDEPAIVKRRIDLFNQRTIPLLEYYEYCQRQRLITVRGEQSPEAIFQEILTQILSRS